MPEVHVHIRKRFTGVGVDELNVHIERHTGFIVDDVSTNEFTADIFYFL